MLPFTEASPQGRSPAPSCPSTSISASNSIVDVEDGENPSHHLQRHQQGRFRHAAAEFLKEHRIEGCAGKRAEVEGAVLGHGLQHRRFVEGDLHLVEAGQRLPIPGPFPAQGQLPPDQEEGGAGVPSPQKCGQGIEDIVPVPRPDQDFLERLDRGFRQSWDRFHSRPGTLAPVSPGRVPAFRHDLGNDFRRRRRFGYFPHVDLGGSGRVRRRFVLNPLAGDALFGDLNVAAVPAEAVVLFQSQRHADLRGDHRLDDEPGAESDFVDHFQIRGVGHHQGQAALGQPQRDYAEFLHDLPRQGLDYRGRDMGQLLAAGRGQSEFFTQRPGNLEVPHCRHLDQIGAELAAENHLVFESLLQLPRGDQFFLQEQVADPHCHTPSLLVVTVNCDDRPNLPQ
jgi:hypothetical protein